MIATTNVIANSVENVKYNRIPLLDHETAHLRVCSHRTLEEYISTLKGKHAKTVANELRWNFQRWCRVGVFGANTKLLKNMYNSRVQEQICKPFDKFTKVVANYSQGGRCIQREFVLEGIVPANQMESCEPWDPRVDIDYFGTTENVEHNWMVVGDGGVGGCSSGSHRHPSGWVWGVSREFADWKTIDGGWLLHHHRKWVDVCRKFNWRQHVDYEGTTPWGRATRESVAQLEIPAITAVDDPDKRGYAQARLDNLSRGTQCIVSRSHSRMYHAITNMPKVDRRRMRLAWRPVVEVDMHASYITLLASLLSPSERRSVVESVQSLAFYEPFVEAYEAYAERLRQNLTDEEAQDRLQGVKAEFNRQCLFSDSSYIERQPLFAVLARLHPALADKILHLNILYGKSGLSHRVQEMEGRLFVDSAIPAIYKICPVIGIHDGLIVPEHMAEEAKHILERIAYRQLGFVPGIAIKRPAGHLVYYQR